MLTSLSSPLVSYSALLSYDTLCLLRDFIPPLSSCPGESGKRDTISFFFLILLFLFRMKHQHSRGNRSLRFLGLFWGGGKKLLSSSGENEPFQEELGNCGSCSLLPSPYVILHSQQDRWPDRSSLLSLYFHLVPSSLYFLLLVIAGQLICTTAHLLVLGQASAVKATVTQENILLS